MLERDIKGWGIGNERKEKMKGCGG